MQAELVQLSTLFARFFQDSQTLPLSVSVEPETIRRKLSDYSNFSEPKELETLLDDVIGMLKAWTEHSQHPRYFGLFNPATDPVTVLADTLVALFNPQVGSWDFAPAANEMERHVLLHVADRLGFPLEPNACHFTTGGSESNQTAVNVALTHQFPGLGRTGILGLKGQPRFYISEEGHHSFEKIAQLVGIGRDNLVTIPADDNLKMDVTALGRQIAQDRSNGLIPFMVIGTAGTTNAGVVDPLIQIAGLCREQKLWFHVDGAWGAAAAFSDRLLPYLKGIELADSVTLDAHKWLSVPMAAGLFLCRHAASVAGTYAIDTAYVPEKGGDGRFYTYRNTVQWSRRFIGLKLFMLLALEGASGIEGRINHQAALGDFLRTRLKDRGWILANQTPLPLVCFSHPDLMDREDRHRQIVDCLADNQLAWISKTKLRNKSHVLRACITNFRSTREDVETLVRGLDRALAVLKRD